MKLIQKSIFISIYIASVTVSNLSAHPIFNIFCCTTFNTAIHPTQTSTGKYHPNHNAINNEIALQQAKPLQRLKRLQRFSEKAKIQAVRLENIINNDELMQNKDYDSLENLTYEQAYDMQIKDSPYISFHYKQLAYTYSIYEENDDNLPHNIKKLRQSHKK